MRYVIADISHPEVSFKKTLNHHLVWCCSRSRPSVSLKKKAIQNSFLFREVEIIGPYFLSWICSCLHSDSAFLQEIKSGGLYSQHILSSFPLLVPSCQTVAITVWVGFPISIPALRQSLFYCKLRALRGFWEAVTWLFPGSFSPEQESNRGEKGVFHRDAVRELEYCEYMCIQTHRQTHSHTHIHRWTVLR